jgi:hypothetical protein
MVPVGDVSLDCWQNIAERTPFVSTIRRDEKEPGIRVDLDISLD